MSLAIVSSVCCRRSATPMMPLLSREVVLRVDLSKPGSAGSQGRWVVSRAMVRNAFTFGNGFAVVSVVVQDATDQPRGGCAICSRQGI
ncbi:hypothetical protein E2C01_000554 [Portunus trituberculatus]|uniref:Uncharacterized protein n=1 Tax=Portunus trituberculatus TaxID=210409 RepID=A0A5B7CFE4_PORTR|nr:hypothetical protein [Portunus trituberculatus]